ncbi:MAG: sugar phosphate nucleotidyltransferase [Armatimonadota bacterium]|jgi:glucose-1-phosphate cytidylyltransferase
MQTVILAGGKGTRLFGDSAPVPKGLIEIGDRPVLWHIMKLYAHYGFDDFIVCLGYKGEAIREYFAREGRCSADSSHAGGANWRVNFVDTGPETATGGRIKRVEQYIEGDRLFATYGDGLSDMDLNELLAYHREHGKIATLTAVRAACQFGVVRFDDDNAVTDFIEKPPLPEWINGGFCVFERAVFDFLGEDDVLEQHTLPRLARAGELRAYPYEGAWACLDTYKDAVALNELWDSGAAPWRVWG